MGSITNRYFHMNNNNEQNLLDSLVQESIQVNGRVYYYLPRNSQVRDLILGEDVVSSFNSTIQIEMYLVDAQGFQGQREMFSKFGLQINNSYRLVMAQDRWYQESASNIRPHEGDLIYDPNTKMLFEIKFVDYDQEFFSLGRNYSFYLSCELFMYQNEVVNTGVPAIDVFGGLSNDTLNFEILLQDGVTPLAQEDYSLLLQELGPTPTRTVETDFITPATTVTTIINNPFNT